MSTINLLPDDYVQRRRQRRANTMCMGLFAVTMVAVVAASLMSEQSARRTAQVRDQVDAAYAHAARLIGEMRQLEVRRQDMFQKAEAISSLLEKVPRSHLLGTITNALPENASLTKMVLDTKRIIAVPPVPAGTPGGSDKFDAINKARAAKAMPAAVSISLTGLAATDVEVARLIANLARNPLTDAVDLVYSQEKLLDKTPVREFQIRLELKPNADVLAGEAGLALAAARTAQPGAAGGAP